jgi:hypothetical protein
MTEQEKFEVWLTSGIKGKPFPKNEDGNYLHMHWQIQWLAWQAAIASRETMPADKIDDVFSSALANMRKHSKIATGALTDEDRYEFHVVRAIERFHGIGE